MKTEMSSPLFDTAIGIDARITSNSGTKKKKRKSVDNTARTTQETRGSYTDMSKFPDPNPIIGRRNRGGVVTPFPEKLYHVLQYAEDNDLSDVISFFPHGRAFAIKKSQRFVEEILPKFFKQSRLTSFQRQLNLYGFRRITQGSDNGGYFHELFLQGRPRLSMQMIRTKIKGAAKQKNNPRLEPNFYAMEPITIDPEKIEPLLQPTSHNMCPEQRQQLIQQQLLFDNTSHYYDHQVVVGDMDGVSMVNGGDSGIRNGMSPSLQHQQLNSFLNIPQLPPLHDGGGHNNTTNSNPKKNRGSLSSSGKKGDPTMNDIQESIAGYGGADGGLPFSSSFPNNHYYH